MLTNIVTAILLIIYFALTWLVGSFIGLSGARVWILRAGLWVIGGVAAWLFLWFDQKLKHDRLLSGPNAAFFSELDALLDHAAKRLKQMAGRELASLPIVYVIGESNTAKTSILEHCGAQPQLLAGEPERDEQIAATSTVNIWLAGNTLLIEAGGKLATDSSLWTYLLQRTQPNLVSASLTSTDNLPSRAILVCFDCGHVAATGDAITTSGKRISARLREAAETLGASLPVYVLFTKLDQVAHFADFVSNLTQEESGQVLGATLPRTHIGEALFTEDAEGNISQALDQLLYSLAGKRLEYLERETTAEKLPSIYEFPRELRKLRPSIIQLLVELSRPAHMEASCFLRGFYFSGVRAVVISETVNPPKVTAAAAASVAAATRMFNMEDLQAMTQPQSGPVVQSRKVPEWSFLPSLFNEVILNDQWALDASRHSRNVERSRAALLGFAAAFCLAAAALFAMSFFWNRGLEQNVLQKSQALQGITEIAPGQLATAAQLQSLDDLRASLLQLQTYEQGGLNTRDRLGLYAGKRIYPDARQIYFASFNKLLLHPIQASMLQRLGQLPARVSASDEFGGPYKTLKTYLITTANADKSTLDFLAPALLEQWTSGQQVDDDRAALARKQFDFYSAQLATANPLPSDPDTATVEHARQYLRQFNGIESIYQSMLAEAARNNHDVDFNRQYPGSSQVLTETHNIPAAFTRAGFVAMQDEMGNPDKFYGAEEWVLGQASSINMPKDKLQAELKNRYGAEYLNQWRSFLRSANIAHYGSANDAANKLRVLSGNRSPLMEFFWIAAVNTNVDLPGSAKSFDAVQRVASGATEDHPIGPGAQTYMTALNMLQGAMSSVAATPDALADSGPLNSALVAAGTARSSVGQVAQGFLIDSESHIDSQVRKLMEDPVVSAESLVRRLVQQQAEKQQKQQAEKQ
jgi:type VI secretion system protein ImpL